MEGERGFYSSGVYGWNTVHPTKLPGMGPQSSYDRPVDISRIRTRTDPPPDDRGLNPTPIPPSAWST